MVKLDVEGFEDKAFKGMKKVIGRSPNMRMFLEFTIDAYDDPEGFFKELKKTFGHISAIELGGSGKLVPVSSFKELEAASPERWSMLLLTHDAN